jgi:hypothetical protein
VSKLPLCDCHVTACTAHIKEVEMDRFDWRHGCSGVMQDSSCNVEKMRPEIKSRTQGTKEDRNQRQGTVLVFGGKSTKPANGSK